MAYLGVARIAVASDRRFVLVVILKMEMEVASGWIYLLCAVRLCSSLGG